MDIRNKIMKEIKDLPDRTPGMIPDDCVTVPMIAEELEISHSKARTKLNYLAQTGILEKDDSGVPHLYRWNGK